MNKLQPYKGTRDFYPEDYAKMNFIFNAWRKVSLSYGYQEYMTPMIEPSSLYSVKGSQEIVNEQTYSFVDRAGRPVTIRTEITPSLARIVAAKRQELNYPMRLFIVPNVMRYERPQKGRVREFWQYNADIIGLADEQADVEIIKLSNDILIELGAKPSDFSILVNNRRLVDAIFKSYFNFDEATITNIIRLVDRLKKMPEADFRIALRDLLPSSQQTDQIINEIFGILTIKNINKLPGSIKEFPEYQVTLNILSTLKALNVSSVKFDMSIVRGFDYYTDMVFEIFDNDPDNNRSMFGGGRYEGLVGQFGVENIPAVGMAIGDTVLMNFLEARNLIPKKVPSAEAIIIPIGLDEQDDKNKLAVIANELRLEGVNVSVDYSNRKIDKMLKNALNNNPPFIIFIGQEDLKNEQVVLKNSSTHEEQRVSVVRAISLIKDRR